MAKLDNDVLETFVNFLDEKVGFQVLPKKKKYHICKLAFSVEQKQNQHKHYEDFGFIHY